LTLEFFNSLPLGIIVSALIILRVLFLVDVGKIARRN
jgi:hypothetical protein